VAGARRNQLFVFPGKIGGIFNGESFFPIGPVAVFDPKRHGSTDGLAVAHSGEDIGAVFFDFLPAAATVAELAAMELVIDEIEVHRKRCGQAGNKGEQSLSMRFTGCVEAQHAIWNKQCSGAVLARPVRGEKG
jgi:hypothetical protein